MYESVYTHIANLKLSRTLPSETKSETTSETTRNEANDDFCKLVLIQLSELKNEVQSLKNHIPITENISLVIAESSLEDSEYCSDEESNLDETIAEALYEAMAVNQARDEIDKSVDQTGDDVEQQVVDDEEQQDVEEQQVVEQVADDVEQQVADDVEQQVVDEQQVVEQVVDDEEQQVVDDEEYTEIEIDGISYCTNDETNGIIYEVDDDGGVGKKVGYIKNEEPFFY